MLVMSLLLLIGCEKGSYVIHDGSLKHEENIYTGEYKSFDGYIEYSLGELKDVHLKYSISTKSGNLKIYFLDEKREHIKVVDGETGGDLRETFKNKQRVWLKLEATKHEGSYSIELLQ